MLHVWELVTELPGYQVSPTYRMRVEGGWLYATYIGADAIAQTFVPEQRLYNPGNYMGPG